MRTSESSFLQNRYRETNAYMKSRKA